MRVVHVHRIRGVSGSERHVLTLLPALRERGVDAVFVGLDDPRGANEPFYDELAGAGVPFERLRAPRDFDPSLLVRLRRALRRLGPDVVHTHLVHADVYGAAALPRRAALVSTKHNDDPFRSGAFRLVERALAQRATRVIAITEALARFTIERAGLPREKVVAVPYGLDAVAPVRDWSAPTSVPADAQLVLAVGRLVPQKGHDVAVRAFARLRRDDAVLAIAGEGTERARLASLAEELGVSTRVLLLGAVTGIAPWLERASVVVHPSRWEGFGLVVLEAMLAARPVVATRVSALPEIVAHGETGLLVPVDDDEALADALRRLLDDAELRARYGTAGLARARAEFSVARMAERTLSVYEAVLAERPAAATTVSAQESTE